MTEEAKPRGLSKELLGLRARVAAMEEAENARRDAEGALRESEERFRLLVEHAADGFLVVEREGRIVDANQRACEEWGYTREELLALSVPDIDIEYDVTRVAGILDRLVAEGGPITIDGMGRRKDGTTFPIEIRVGLIVWSGQPHLFALIRDVTERRQAEIARQSLAVAEERNRLARELHDSVTQSLYSLTLFAETGRRLAGSGDLEGAKDYLGRLGETSQQVLKEMRLLVYQLRPVALEREGLVGALRQRLDAVERRAGVDVRLVFDEAVELPTGVEQELYRVAQEALNNTLKHAAASAVTVGIAGGDGLAELTVEDNGKGFEIDAVGDSAGTGLANMRERVENLGGSLSILSSPGRGTKVSATVPTT